MRITNIGNELQNYKELLDSGAITNDEFQAKKKNILARSVSSTENASMTKDTQFSLILGVVIAIVYFPFLEITSLVRLGSEYFTFSDDVITYPFKYVSLYLDLEPDFVVGYIINEIFDLVLFALSVLVIIFNIIKQVKRK
ncbi:MAG: SHOCT domain-containing protein [Prevotella sp.]|jgi:hypothetical protein|nr:SHOCT domain-containing protein [Prevotella sp.]